MQSREEKDILYENLEYIMIAWGSFWALFFGDFLGNGWGIPLIVAVIGVISGIVLHRIKRKDKKKDDTEAVLKKLGDTEKYGDITSQLGDTKRYGDITSQIEKVENSILKRMGSDEAGNLSYQIGQLGGVLGELREEKRKVEVLNKSDQELFLAADSLRNKYVEAQIENLKLRQEVMRLQQRVEQLERQAQREKNQETERERQEWDLER